MMILNIREGEQMIINFGENYKGKTTEELTKILADIIEKNIAYPGITIINEKEFNQKLNNNLAEYMETAKVQILDHETEVFDFKKLSDDIRKIKSDINEIKFFLKYKDGQESIEDKIWKEL